MIMNILFSLHRRLPQDMLMMITTTDGYFATQKKKMIEALTSSMVFVVAAKLSS